MTTTRAVVLRGFDRGFSLEEIRPAGLRPDEVLVEIAGAGMCHTDMLPRTPEMGARPAPVVLGHEGSGVVTEVGAAVTGVRPGDHVLLSFAFCGTCRECRQGSPACCEEFNLRTVTGGYPDGSTGAVGNPVRNRWSGQSSFARAVPKVCLPRLIDFWRDGRFPFDRPIRTYPMDDIDTAERDPRSGVTIKPVLLS